MKNYIQMLIDSEEKALASDDPEGTCAAHHRGAISAYRMVLSLIESDSRKSESQLVKALKPFISESMQSHTMSFPDDAQVALEVPGRNGFRLNLNLKELRTLWKAYNKDCLE